jgi:hypothetical protein
MGKNGEVEIIEANSEDESMQRGNAKKTVKPAKATIETEPKNHEQHASEKLPLQPP